MGVPKFYRWISERYPLINQKIGHETQFLPVFDNMYLDMNGIIHTCTHPSDEDVSEALSMKEMIIGMFSYVDRMVQIVKPQKVLMLAVDGCAPRAKMNQQRSRRFASAKDRREAVEQALRDGEITEEDARNQFDSNCITPGTEFMDEVGRNFQYFIRKKIKEDPLWQNLKVIYSGHDVPGEGEHKIMDYIRHTRMQPGYEPNLRHCLCGLDADLIMLGLASHEPHFALLREVVDFNAFANRRNKNATKEVKKQVSQDKWQLLHVSTLRQYLDLEFRSIPNLPFDYDLERIIDDWVLLVMLVGNDFLPHLPSLDIGEGALDEMSKLYRQLLPAMGGYITRDGEINFSRLEMIMQRVGEMEHDIFRKRAKENKSRRKNRRGGGSQLPPEEELPISQGMEEYKKAYYLSKFGFGDANLELVNRVRDSYIEGLQWCFQYYYQGVRSWTWFFPFHYAPMASDLVDISSVKVDLHLGKPFLPFMQLLSCLPADSAWCLPKCYRELMVNDTSPIAEFYPRNFDVDMNGKRNPWEGVNLLPFIDEQLLFQAVADHCPESKLTADEVRRNKHGVDYIFEFDATVTETVPSTFPSAGLLDIQCCQSSVKVYTLPPMERFIPRLLQGTVASAPWAGDPQLFSLNLSETRTGLRFCQLNCFGRETRKDTLVLTLAHADEFASTSSRSSQNLDAYFQRCLSQLSVVPPRSNRQTGPTVWVNYPHLHEALVVSVATAFVEAHVQKASTGQGWSFVPKPRSHESTASFKRDAVIAQNRLLAGAELVGTGGVDVGEVLVMLLVRPLSGMDTDPVDGGTTQVFSEETTWIPFQLTSLYNPAPDPRFVPKGEVAIEQRFEKQCTVMCLGKNGYGQVGKVLNVEPDKNRVVCSFDAISPQLPPFGQTIASSIVDKYMSAQRAAKHLGISIITLGKVMGSLKVSPGFNDIGLNLRVGKDYMVPGYARSKSASATRPAWSTGKTALLINGLGHVDTANMNQHSINEASTSAMWEYTTRALELALMYKKKFPKVFKLVEAKPNEREYKKTDMFGKGNEDELDQVCKWLHQLDSYAIPLVPVTSKAMSRDAIKAVESASDNIVQQLTQQKASTEQKFVTVKLPAEMVFRCKNDSFELAVSPSSHLQPQLGDRVENLCNPMIPFGLRGTVVATHASTGCVEVLFDEEFVGGDSLHGQCSPGRGKLLPWSQLLSLSRRVPVKKAPPKPSKALAPWAAPAATQNSNKPVKNMQNNTSATKQVLAVPPPRTAPAVPAKANDDENDAPILGFDVQQSFEGSDDLAEFWATLQPNKKNKSSAAKRSTSRGATSTAGTKKPASKAAKAAAKSLNNELQKIVSMVDGGAADVSSPTTNNAKPATKPAKNQGKKKANKTAPKVASEVAEVKQDERDHLNNLLNKAFTSAAKQTPAPGKQQPVMLAKPPRPQAAAQAPAPAPQQMVAPPPRGPPMQPMMPPPPRGPAGQQMMPPPPRGPLGQPQQQPMMPPPPQQGLMAPPMNNFPPMAVPPPRAPSKETTEKMAQLHNLFSRAAKTQGK